MEALSNENLSQKMYDWATDLFPIGRWLMGDGVRETLNYIKKELPELNINRIPTGEKVFDWEIPEEWEIKDAYIIDPEGNKILDYHDNNLHILGYSEPIDIQLNLEELQNYLYSLESCPNAIPYVTSYYKRRWGFCMSHSQRVGLKPGIYRVVIDSKFTKGHLDYGEIILPGEQDDEVFLSTYVCHPSMANNELSGPVVTLALLKWIKSMPKRRYTYRAVFLPETIGSIAYLSKKGGEMKKKIIAGFVLTCVGDNQAYSFMPSRMGNSYADKIALNVLSDLNINFEKYSFLQRGSDERQYCSPAFDLPIVSLMRSKYGTYKEYHTSLDNLDFISPEGLLGGYLINKACIECIENNFKYRVTNYCEPKMDKRGLRSSIGGSKIIDLDMSNMMNFLAYADGKLDLIDLSKIICVNYSEATKIAGLLLRHNLIEAI